MIHIYKDWYLSANPDCYTVSRKTDSVDKKTGELIYRDMTYHPSISMAVQFVISRVLRDEVRNNEINTLSGVVRRVEALNTELREILSSTAIDGESARYNTRGEYVL